MKLNLSHISIGDILVCIDISEYSGQLIRYKKYKIFLKLPFYNKIVIICDDGTKGVYPLDIFINNTQFRKFKINKLYENNKKKYNRC